MTIDLSTPLRDSTRSFAADSIGSEPLASLEALESDEPELT